MFCTSSKVSKIVLFTAIRPGKHSQTTTLNTYLIKDFKAYVIICMAQRISIAHCYDYFPF